MAGGRAHRRQVAEVDRERAMTDGGRGTDVEVEVDAFDQRVGRDDGETASIRLDDRGVVARPEHHAGA